MENKYNFVTSLVTLLQLNTTQVINVLKYDAVYQFTIVFTDKLVDF